LPSGFENLELKETGDKLRENLYHKSPVSNTKQSYLLCIEKYFNKFIIQLSGRRMLVLLCNNAFKILSDGNIKNGPGLMANPVNQLPF
jgi:hypothetical protein